MEGGDNSVVVTSKVCAMFAFVPECKMLYMCNKCKLVALLEEKVRDLEQWVATLKTVREDEVYIDKTLEQQQLSEGALLTEENQNIPLEENAIKATNIVEEPP